MAATDLDLLRALLQGHLLRMLWAATDLPMLDFTVYALQETLRIGARLNTEGQLPSISSEGEAPMSDNGSNSGSDNAKTPNRLYASLEADVQASVRPYLDSKFTLVNTPVTPSGVLWGTPAASMFRTWLQLWMRQLINAHCQGMKMTVIGEESTGWSEWMMMLDNVT